MQARTMNPKAVVAAALMMVAVVAAPASAAPSRSLGRSVETRTVMKYYQGAWTSPVAVVLKSAADWNAWNQEMVAREMAVGTEALPANVDWSKEAVLVVSLGLKPDARMTVDVSSADRRALTTQVTLSLTNGLGGSSPCVVVAMDKSLAGSVQLVNASALGLPGMAQEYGSAAALAASNAGGASVAVTWGEMKSAYRE